MTPRPPAVSLGRVTGNGISPSIFGLVEHGAQRRPELARELRGTVEIRFRERFAPVRLTFEGGAIAVEDVERSGSADLVIKGSLPDRRVTLEGDRKLARRLLRLLEL